MISSSSSASLFIVSHPCLKPPFDTISTSSTFYAHTSCPLITLDRFQPSLLLSSSFSSSANVHFHNNSYSFWFLNLHKMPKPSLSISLILSMIDSASCFLLHIDFLSSLVTPLVHSSILIPLTICSVSLSTTQHYKPYNIVDFTSLLYNLPFCHIRIILSDKTPDYEVIFIECVSIALWYIFFLNL